MLNFWRVQVIHMKELDFLLDLFFFSEGLFTCLHHNVAATYTVHRSLQLTTASSASDTIGCISFMRLCVVVTSKTIYPLIGLQDPMDIVIGGGDEDGKNALRHVDHGARLSHSLPFPPLDGYVLHTF